jgi:hypothetical protein
MPNLTVKGAEIEVSIALVARMADRLYKLQGEGRRQNYVDKARKRLEAGPARRTDAATVLAAGA